MGFAEDGLGMVVQVQESSTLSVKIFSKRSADHGSLDEYQAAGKEQSEENIQ